jgi:uncharacterized membrane protein HdeD (DUF308 family)
MSTLTHNQIPGVLTEAADRVRRFWGWFLFLGILQIVAGTVAVGFAFSATLVSVVTLGVLLLISAGGQIVASVLARDWGGFFLFLLLGVLYAVAGIMMIRQPLVAAESLTLMLAAAFLIGGMFRVIVALIERFPSWGWVLFNGVVTVILGVLIWRQWPSSGLWVLGMFVGIDLIMNGVTWSVLAVGARKGLAQLTSN